jgi:hypothetical protein
MKSQLAYVGALPGDYISTPGQSSAMAPMESHRAVIRTDYGAASLVKDMTKSPVIASVPFDTFQRVVSGLLGVIVTLIAGAWFTLNGTVTDIKTDQKEIAKQIGSNHTELVGTINTTRIEFVKSIDEVAKQIAVSNQKLDNVANGLRKIK